MTTKVRRLQQEAGSRRIAMRNYEAEIRALEDECSDLRRMLAASDKSLETATAEILRLRALVPNDLIRGASHEP